METTIGSLASNIPLVRERVARAAQKGGRSPEEITVVAVTKTVPVDRIVEAYNLGTRHFGENRVQEAASKIEELADRGIKPTWHMVGHLQTNKVKKVMDLFDIIHSVDSLRLAQTVNDLAPRRIPVFVQVNVGEETTKGGFLLPEVPQALEEIAKCSKLEVLGLMTIAPLVSDPEDVRPLFRKLRMLARDLGLRHLSMGMTDDFEVAIEEGATMVRIGRAIFGERKG